MEQQTNCVQTENTQSNQYDHPTEPDNSFLTENILENARGLKISGTGETKRIKLLLVDCLVV